MRPLASFLLLGITLTAGATEIWRWKDADGVVHISDRPVPGAELVQITGGVSTTSRPPQAAPAAPPIPNTAARSPAPARPVTVAYTSCAVSSPVDDTVFQSVDTVAVSLQIEPALQGGHRIQVLLNNAPVADWPENQPSYTLTGLYRGSYTLSARIVDAGGRSYCNGAAVSFHVRQPTVKPVLRPQRG